MRILAAYLWKEWRDQRAVVLGFFVAVPVLIGIARLVLPDAVADEPMIAGMALVGSFALSMLIFASDLVPGEARRGQLDFLRRMPADLSMAFLAKLIVLLLGAALFTFYGWAVTGWITGARPPLEPEPLLIGLWVLPWILAVSCWLPRGALTLPATAIFLGLLALPLYLIYSSNVGLAPTKAVAIGSLCALPVGALVVAWLSFAHGYRFGRGIGGAALRGILASLVLVAPAWGYAGLSAYQWRRFELEECVVRNVWVGEGSRYLFVNAEMLVPLVERSGPVHALRVDLERGDWSIVGEPGESFERPAHQHFPFHQPLPLVALQVDREDSDHIWNEYYDGRTGKRLKDGWSDHSLGELDAVRDRASGGIPMGWRDWSSAGLGFVVLRESERRIFDPFRNKLYDDGAWGNRIWQIRVRPGRWIVRRHDARGEHLFDPDTGESEFLTRGVATALPDGGLLLHERSGVWRLDGDQRTEMPADAMSASVLMSGADGSSLLIAGDGVALLGPRGTELKRLPYSWERFQPMALEPDRCVIGVLDGRRVIRVRPGSTEVETLFPR